MAKEKAPSLFNLLTPVSPVVTRRRCLLTPQALTFYLGSILYKMGDFCILCVSTYVFNWSLLVVAIREVRALAKRKPTAKRA